MVSSACAEVAPAVTTTARTSDCISVVRIVSSPQECPRCRSAMAEHGGPIDDRCLSRLAQARRFQEGAEKNRVSREKGEGRREKGKRAEPALPDNAGLQSGAGFQQHFRGVLECTASRVLTMSFVVLCGFVARAQSQPATPCAAAQAPAAPAPGRGGGRGGPSVVSPQIEPDGRVTFRLLAPNATTVTVAGTSTAVSFRSERASTSTRVARAQCGRGGGTPAVTMTKGENGIWSGTTIATGQARRMALHLHRRRRHRCRLAQRQRDDEPDAGAEPAGYARRFL